MHVRAAASLACERFALTRDEPATQVARHGGLVEKSRRQGLGREAASPAGSRPGL